MNQLHRRGLFIFPADAGVNLTPADADSKKSYIPRGCGGEPIIIVRMVPIDIIFPADAGVNLIGLVNISVGGYIPRGCGGEPDSYMILELDGVYSPRMRG